MPLLGLPPPEGVPKIRVYGFLDPPDLLNRSSYVVERRLGGVIVWYAGEEKESGLPLLCSLFEGGEDRAFSWF